MTYKQHHKTCKPLRYRVKPTGEKHEYLLIKVLPKKCKGKRGGRTEAELVKFKHHHKKGESPFIKA